MQFKPFRPPAFLQGPAVIHSNDDEPPVKKRRISEEFRTPAATQIPSQRPAQSEQHASTFRTPLSAIKNPMASSPISDAGGPRQAYSILWRKVTAKKHKTWDGDGTLIVVDGYASLKNEKGKYMGRTPCKTALEPGTMLSISGMDVEIDDVLSSETEPADDPRPSSPPAAMPARRPMLARPTLAVRPTQMPAELISMPEVASSQRKSSSKSGERGTSASTSKPFKSTLVQRTNSDNVTGGGPTPRHDPTAEGALVMRRPRAAPKGKQIVDVVVDPHICRKLREHQREGVAFMYECVMGLRCKEGAGAILADEMGLGKSLQTIALIWTMLKQNPIYGDPPLARKAIIICPATVVNNWKKEFRKWLGNERVGVLALSQDQKRISSFVRGKSYQVLVLSYEMFNSSHKDLQKCQGIDLIVADEGHRLKTSKNKTIAAVNALDIERRIVLTGTLLQNDYSEWFTVVDFVNPGFLGKYSTFKKDFENPILRSRQQGASPEDIEKGAEADKELKAQTGSFILRRTAEILAKYLPGKTEYVLLCRPTDFQVEIYQQLLSSGLFNAALGSTESPLPFINILKKACNSPSLLAPSLESDEEAPSVSAVDHLSTITAAHLRSATTSGKLRALDSLLHTIRTTTCEKVVLMSNYTKTLDILSVLLTKLDYRFLRLDGQTPSKQRQDLVDSFNYSPPERVFVFLMSTKAGGVGLNLIGASRLVLFDIDWNPAHDAQAMARICRDGQKRPCFIYRLVTKGAIEERIFQRQVMKMGLADSVVDGKSGGKETFSREELRDLFRLDMRESCRTHDVLGCGCKMDGEAIRADDEIEKSEEAEDAEDEDEAVGTKAKGFGMPKDFMRASQLDPEDPDPVRSRTASPAKNGRQEELRGLMLYSHLDARRWRKHQAGGAVTATDKVEEEEDEDKSNPGPDDADEKNLRQESEETHTIQDAVLRKIILEEHSAVDFVFAKASKNSTGQSSHGAQTE